VDDLAAFARLIDALRPWLGDLVIVGGWAHRLHRFTPLAGSPGYRPVTTRDADLAFGPHRSLSGNMAAALKAAGFEQELSGDEIPPVAAYRLGSDDQGFFAEFLTPLLGDGTRRSGQTDATMRTAGITAQKLRQLDLLLTSPWTLSLSRDMGVPVREPVVVKVANPVSFIAQKLLIMDAGSPTSEHKTRCTFTTRWSCSGDSWRPSARSGLRTCNQPGRRRRSGGWNDSGASSTAR